MEERETFEPNSEIETEFTKPLENILWISQNIPKNKMFLSGLEK